MAQQGILSLSIKDKQALYKSYMPFVSGGGLFVPSAKHFSLGESSRKIKNLTDEIKFLRERQKEQEAKDEIKQSNMKKQF